VQRELFEGGSFHPPSRVAGRIEPAHQGEARLFLATDRDLDLQESPIAVGARLVQADLALDLKELEKIISLAFLFGFAAPVSGIVMAGRPNLQRLGFGVLCFLIPSGIQKPEEWGLTLASLEDFYRGHATGYHFYFAEAAALGLVIGQALEDWRQFRVMPPGLWLYLLHCALCFISIVNAPSTSFVYMAAFKMVKISIIFVAGYNFFRTEGNVRFFLWMMAGILGIQLMSALRQRYILGIYQVTGSFEHQNALAMFAILIGMVFLAAALGPKERGSNLFLLAYLGCAAVVESTFSRGGMVIFAVGSALLGISTVFDKCTRRRFAILGLLGVIAVAGLALSLDTIRARFQDYGNEASGMTRVLLNQASRNMVHDHPLGVGWNNFAFVINRPFNYGDIVDEWEREGGVTIDPHYQKGLVESLYYLVLAETGWQGLISLVLLMAVFLWWNLRAIFFYRYHFVGAVSLGILFGCGCNYLQSTLERVLIQPRNMMLWLLLLALTARIETWRRADARQRKQPALDQAEPRSLMEVHEAGAKPVIIDV
jgi:hypothetical protein